MVNKVKVKCPECGSESVVKSGTYRTKRWGLKMRRKCKECATTFYDDYEQMKEAKK